MAITAIRKNAQQRALPKAATGIQGLDEITGGGLPRGRPTLVCGSAGCGKTLLAMQFVVHGALQLDEPGVFMAFEESAADLTQNVRSLGFDLDDLVAQKKLVIDFVRVERSEIEETGDYDLEGLFVRLGHAIDTIGAKRVVLDTIETLFAGLSNEGILRAELRRLFRWLKDRGMTAIITAERGAGTLSRHGLEEYISDCVILLDHRATDQVSTRRLRVVKYRGTSHGTNEYPFLIDEKGISVLPITSYGLQHDASSGRVSTGIPRLDRMLGGQGYYRGSTVLVSGTAGTGKTSMAAHFVNASCQRGERCLFLSFEESQAQFVRNMGSIGLDLQRWIHKGVLHYRAHRPGQYGLESHLALMHRWVEESTPQMMVIDPIGSLVQGSKVLDASVMLTRLIDFLKMQGITTLMTNLTHGGDAPEATQAQISSLVDTWLLLRDTELGGERNRALYILKSRGMPHSNQLREFVMTDRGIDLLDVYLGPDGVLTGSARRSQEAREVAAEVQRRQGIEAKQRTLARRREAVEAQIAALRKSFDAEADEAHHIILEAQYREDVLQQDRAQMAANRQADAIAPVGGRTRKTRGKRK
jgi:circadian clock protein KaiC